MREWPAVDYDDWRRTCDTLHAHTQILGKLAAALAPREPQFQHLALRLTTRGWETAPLPAPDRSGALSVALDLRSHEAIAEHSDGRTRSVALTPNRSVREVTCGLLSALGEMGGGSVRFDPAPQEVPWSVPLDEDEGHCHYEPDEASRYFEAATQAALVLAQLRAPYDGHSTPVNAWWGSFDLAVSFFSDLPTREQRAAAAERNTPERDVADRSAGKGSNTADAARPDTAPTDTAPADSAPPDAAPADSAPPNAARPDTGRPDAARRQRPTREMAVGWWPGDSRYGKAAFYAYASPSSEGFEEAALSPPAARWESQLGEFLLDWDDVRLATDPRAFSLSFGRSALSHGHMAPALSA